MAEPYSEAHASIAISVLSEAHDIMVEEGFGEVEAAHALIHMGLDLMRSCCCEAHLHGELEVVAEVVADRLDALKAAAQ